MHRVKIVCECRVHQTHFVSEISRTEHIILFQEMQGICKFRFLMKINRTKKKNTMVNRANTGILNLHSRLLFVCVCS